MTGDGLAGFLAVLALPYVRDPLRVTWMERDHVPAARVQWGGDAWEIELASGMGADRLAFAWYHELAHVVNGDVARSPAAALPLERGTILFPGIAAQVAADKERAADDWARARVSEMGPVIRRFLGLLAGD